MNSASYTKFALGIVIAQLVLGCSATAGDGLGFFGGSDKASEDTSTASPENGLPGTLNPSGSAVPGVGALGTGAGAVGKIGSSTVTQYSVHNPEPASMALFGGGLAGLALWKQRKARRRTS